LRLPALLKALSAAHSRAVLRSAKVHGKVSPEPPPLLLLLLVLR
jgi:hypothetical protein